MGGLTSHNTLKCCAGQVRVELKTGFPQYFRVLDFRREVEFQLWHLQRVLWFNGFFRSAARVIPSFDSQGQNSLTNRKNRQTSKWPQPFTKNRQTSKWPQPVSPVLRLWHCVWCCVQGTPMSASRLCSTALWGERSVSWLQWIQSLVLPAVPTAPADPNTKRFKQMLIYFNTDTQCAHFRGNPLYQASKQHLNSR